MIANQKRDNIYKLIRAAGFAKEINFAKIFKVTEVTKRQDLEKLENDEFIRKKYGGASLKSMNDQLQSIACRGENSRFNQGIKKAKIVLGYRRHFTKIWGKLSSIGEHVVKKAMVQAAFTKYLVADFTKIGKSTFTGLTLLSLIDYTITGAEMKKHKKLFDIHEIELFITD